MTPKTIDLHAPKSWNELTLDQWALVKKLAEKKYASQEAYLAQAFLMLTGLKPILYAEQWRNRLSKIPFLSRFILKTGRQVEAIGADGYETWKQYYKKGRTRFWMADWEVVDFKDSLKWLLNADCYVLTNPVGNKRWRLKKFLTPQSILSDVTWEEFKQCDMYIKEYRQSKKDSDLYNFILSVYKYNVRAWERLIGVRLPGPSDIPRLFSPLEMELILRYWDSSMRYYSTICPHLFSKAKDGEEYKRPDYFKEEAEVTTFLTTIANCELDKAHKMQLVYCFTYMETAAKNAENQRKSIEKMKKNR